LGIAGNWERRRVGTFSRMGEIDRRRFVKITGAGAAALIFGYGPFTAKTWAQPRFSAYPFKLGVASGDPAPDGVVLWTRLAPDPLAENGRGGMPNQNVVMDWEVSTTESFRRLVRSGRVTARPELGHSVHVEVGGLLPNRQYFYRFRAGNAESPVGRTRTTPAPGAALPGLTFAAVSCQQYEHGFFTAYGRLADENPDLVVHLGDYIYEYAPNEYRAPGGNVRVHEGGETTTLAAGDGTDPPNPEQQDPARTLTGAEQEQWLLSGLAASGSTWNVMAQQAFFAQRDFDTGAGQRFSMDAWDGYIGSRDRISNFILERDVQNPVVLTGDVHNNWACDLKADYDDPASETFGVEFVATSVTSGGDGADTSAGQEAVVAANPHIKFFNGQRGYVLCTLTPGEWRADYRALPYVSQPGAPVYTRASFVAQAGAPGLQPAGTNPVQGVRVSAAAIESETERVEAQEEAR
jgi:phosphodiesterase/alkaline phosphatase D-like protein